MTMHWTPPKEKIPKHPEPGEYVTVIGYCGCGRETGRQTLLWPSERRTYSMVVSCPGSWQCGLLEGGLVLQWTYWGDPIDLRAYVRPHP